MGGVSTLPNRDASAMIALNGVEVLIGGYHIKDIHDGGMYNPDRNVSWFGHQKNSSPLFFIMLHGASSLPFVSHVSFPSNRHCRYTLSGHDE